MQIILIKKIDFLHFCLYNIKNELFKQKKEKNLWNCKNNKILLPTQNKQR